MKNTIHIAKYYGRDLITFCGMHVCRKETGWTRNDLWTGPNIVPEQLTSEYCEDCLEHPDIALHLLKIL